MTKELVFSFSIFPVFHTYGVLSHSLLYIKMHSGWSTRIASIACFSCSVIKCCHMDYYLLGVYQLVKPSIIHLNHMPPIDQCNWRKVHSHTYTVLSLIFARQLFCLLYIIANHKRGYLIWSLVSLGQGTHTHFWATNTNMLANLLFA